MNRSGSLRCQSITNKSCFHCKEELFLLIYHKFCVPPLSSSHEQENKKNIEASVKQDQVYHENINTFRANVICCPYRGLLSLYADKIWIFSIRSLSINNNRYYSPYRTGSIYPDDQDVRGPRIFHYDTLSANIFRSICILVKAHIM